MTQPLPSTLHTAVWCAGSSLGAALPDSPPGETPPSSADKAAAITAHRISRLAIDHPDGLELDESDWERVRTDALAHTHAAFQLVGHTGSVVELLTTESVRFLVIKGVALGALSQTPAGRGAGDVDILIDPVDVPRVHNILHRHGFRTALALPDITRKRTWRLWQYIEREASYVSGAIHIDLHWRISTQRKLFPSFDDLYSRSTQVTIGDTTVPTLGVADSLAASCYHAYFDEFQPVRCLMDVVSLLRTLGAGELPDYPPALRKLISGVVGVVAEVFPGVVDAEAQHVIAHTAPPPRVVAERFEQALQHSRAPWGTRPSYRAQWRRARAEAHFDTPLDGAPRFLGRRLVRFEPWRPDRPTMTFGEAFANRVKIEISGLRRALRYKKTRQAG